MLKINEAFLLASTEQEILAAMGLYADREVTLHLLYLEWEGTAVNSATVAASWKDGQRACGESLAVKYAAPESTALSGFVAALMAVDDPVWFVEDVPRQDLTLLPFLQGTRSLVVIKLQGVGPYAGCRWPAAICFAWPTPHTFSVDEKRLYTTLFQFASAVVSNLRMYQQTLQHVDQLRELDRLKDQFLYSISHELHTPLVGIISIAELLLYGVVGEISPTVRREVQIVLQSGEHLLALVNDVLDLARMEAGTFQLQREPLQIDRVIADAVQATDTRGLAVQVSVSSDLPAVVADRTRVRQVILNLLSNAVKFAEKGVVEIAARVEGQALVTSVHDEGIGISPEHQTLIFEPFRQVDGALTRKKGGAGLGLPISKRLVELHGGRLWVASAAGQGSTFYFSLPLPEEGHG
jgi:signal transduction histidine kinase